MSKNLKTFLGISYLIILIAFLYFIFTSVELSKLNDFEWEDVKLENYQSHKRIKANMVA